MNYYKFFFFTYIIIESITSSEILFSVFDPSKHTHTWSSGHTHTHTHLEQWTHTHTHTHTHLEQWTHTHTHTLGAVGTHTHTHTWSSEHSSLRRSSSTATACNFIQDSLVCNTLNDINIYYRTIISPINISIEIIYYLRKRSQFEYSSV